MVHPSVMSETLSWGTLGKHKTSSDPQIRVVKCSLIIAEHQRLFPCISLLRKASNISHALTNLSGSPPFLHTCFINDSVRFAQYETNLAAFVFYGATRGVMSLTRWYTLRFGVLMPQKALWAKTIQISLRIKPHFSFLARNSRCHFCLNLCVRIEERWFCWTRRCERYNYLERYILLWIMREDRYCARGPLLSVLNPHKE